MLMSSEIAIKINNLSKYYQIYKKPYHRLLDMLRSSNNPLGYRFWAVQPLSFDVKKGETIGIIGKNGSGKSTLLQLIAGTLNPSSGDIQTNGRIAALLELGSGFDPDFTGSENITINASILGLSSEEIKRHYNDIVSFADIGSFIDRPVKTYSSGMFVRLAFAISAHIQPQILIVDEALSVGDLAFQNKCVKKIQDLKASGTSIIFVSHDLSTIQIICDRVFWMQEGNIKLIGSPTEVCQQYYADMLNPEAIPALAQNKIIPQQSTDKATFINISLTNETNTDTQLFHVGDQLHITFELLALVNLDDTVFSISIYRSDGDWSIGQTSREKQIIWPGIRSGDTMTGKLSLSPLSLTPGDYSLVLGAHSIDHQIFYALTDFVCHFTVRSTYQTWGKFIHPCAWNNTLETTHA